MPFEAAYNLSFLVGTEQEWTDTGIKNILSEDDSFNMPIKMAEVLRSKNGKLSQSKIDKVLKGHKVSTNSNTMSVTLGAKILSPYFYEGTSTKDIQAGIVEALEYKYGIDDLILKHLSSGEPSEFDIEDFIKFFKADFRLPNLKKEGDFVLK
jgi:hypothetical protein